MKRDLDLIRKILLRIVSCKDSKVIKNNEEIQIKGYDDAYFVLYHMDLLFKNNFITGLATEEQQHMDLLSENNFITGLATEDQRVPLIRYYRIKLGTAGYELLGNLKSKSAWETVNEYVKSKLGSVSLDALQALLKQEILKAFGL